MNMKQKSNYLSIINKNCIFSRKRVLPLSGWVLEPNDQDGALVSYRGLFCGEYVQGPGPSMSILSGGRALFASSHPITFLGFLGSSQYRLLIGGRGAGFVLQNTATFHGYTSLFQIQCRIYRSLCHCNIYTNVHLRARAL